MTPHPAPPAADPVLDAMNVPLEGSGLIQASAGTGKTYQLANLFLRLVVEKSLRVDQILVVTFTKAAVAELSLRLRDRLRQALEVFQGKDTTDPFLTRLAERAEPGAAILLLDAALRHFDEAAVFTIHGFCQRALTENAFESGAAFDPELATNQNEAIVRIARDFFRIHYYGAHKLLVKKLGNGGLAKLAENLSWLGKYPDVDILDRGPRPPDPDPAAFYAAAAPVREAWPKAREEVERLLLDAGLNGTVYGSLTSPSKKREGSVRQERIAALALAMDEWCSQKDAYPLPKLLERLTTKKINRSTNKKSIPIDLPFFHDCQALWDAEAFLNQQLDDLLAFLNREAFSYGKEDLGRRGAEENILYFSDLITGLRDALAGPRGPALAAALQKKYPAALIDEFQDTDPAQYEIFRTLFEAPGQTLFCIGDPKQAIYGFRGADIFSYIQAAREADRRYTLLQNWRSDPDLIQGANAFFSLRKNPFVLPEVPFFPAEPAPRVQEEMKEDGRKAAPLEIWLFEPEPGKKNILKAQAREASIQAVVCKIRELLAKGRQGSLRIGGEPVTERHMAVLVRTNPEAAAVRDALVQGGIHCVLYSTANLFDSPQALWVRRVMAAVARPGEARGLRAALSTPLLGLDAARLSVLSRDPAQWAEAASDFSRWHALWKGKGFVAMFRTLLRDRKVRSRLLARPLGERDLTNVLHLGEAIHQAQIQNHLGMSGLLEWLDRAMDSSLPRPQEHQLRLESDAEAVQVVTMHRSKGLEYPVVFCPFPWHDSSLKSKAVAFHNPDDDYRLALDLVGGDEDRKALALMENLAENIRLFYVAATRARHRLYLSWGLVKESTTSAPAWLFHHGDGEGEDFSRDLSQLKNKYKKFTIEEMKQDLEALEEEARGSIHVTAPPQSDVALPPGPVGDSHALACSLFTGLIDQSFGVSSFSSLAMAGKNHDTPGLDEKSPFASADSPCPEEKSAFSFPRGPAAGRFLHELLEWDFSRHGNPRSLKSLEKEAAETLPKFGLAPDWAPVAAQMAADLLATPLSKGANPALLGRIAPIDQVSEMEFVFPVHDLTPEKLSRLNGGELPEEFQKLFSRSLASLGFYKTNGFVRGFIDLVFRHAGRYFVVDYKSNHLGNRVEDYNPAALAGAMAEHRYSLQYLLYAAALHRHLKTALPGYDHSQHFGGVYYLFLRGMKPENGPETGVFFDCPGREALDGLD